MHNQSKRIANIVLYESVIITRLHFSLRTIFTSTEVRFLLQEVHLNEVLFSSDCHQTTLSEKNRWIWQKVI